MGWEWTGREDAERVRCAGNRVSLRECRYVSAAAAVVVVVGYICIAPVYGFRREFTPIVTQLQVTFLVQHFSYFPSSPSVSITLTRSSSKRNRCCGI